MAPEAERLVKGVVPPTAPVNVTAPPPAVTVNALPPFNVPPKVIAPFNADVLIVKLPANVAATLLVTTKDLAVIPLAMLKVPVFAEEMVISLSAVPPPTAPDRVIELVPAFRTKVRFPSIVPPNEIAPGVVAFVSIVIPAVVRFVGVALFTEKELAVILLARFKVPAAADAIEKEPSLVVPPTAPVKVMVLVPAFKVKF